MISSLKETCLTQYFQTHSREKSLSFPLFTTAVCHLLGHQGYAESTIWLFVFRDVDNQKKGA